MIKLEICAINLESAIAAQEGGADRIELCDNIIEGGTTPSAATIRLAKKHLTIPINVLIRPRGGDFLYSDIEFENIIEDIKFCKESRINGVVIGVLKKDGSVDIEKTKLLVKEAWPMEITFHRAFDVCNNPFQAMEDIIECGIDRILTSGQEKTAFEGIDLIKELQEKAKGRIIIMAGSGVNKSNIKEIINETKVTEIHLSAKSQIPTKMEYKQNKLSMSGGDWANEEYYWASNIDVIKKLRKSTDNTDL
jgi:copper homeostasis protein